MKRVLVAVLLLCLAIPAAAQSGPYLVNYFSNNGGVSGGADQQLRLLNFGLNGTPMTVPVGDVCANIYVFDANQEMAECCSCRITPNGLLTLEVGQNLTSNPVTSVVPLNGDIKVLSTNAVGTAACLPTSLNGGLTDSIVGFGTHLVGATSGSSGTVTLPCTILTGPTELNGNIDCPQFNGTGLTSMTLTFTGSVNGSITLTNNGSGSATGSAQTSSQFLNGAMPGFTIPTPLFTASFSTGSITLSNTPPNNTQTTPGLSGSQSLSVVNTTVFAPYEGAGTFPIPITTSTTLSITGGGGNFAASQQTTATATATVTYTGASSSTTQVPIEALVPGLTVNDGERDFLLNACQYVKYLGSGRGTCGCGR